MWFKVDGGLAFHPKIMQAGNEAMGLWVRAGAWSCEQLTDGFIPKEIANAMANGMANAMALVMANLWQEVDGGFQFKDWDEFQPSGAEERERKRIISEKRKAAGQKGAAARWHGKTMANAMANAMANGMANAMANGWQTDGPDPDPDISKPNGLDNAQNPPKSEQATKHAYPADFENFWQTYPKKADKRTALNAWKKATTRATAEDILDGATRYRDDPNRDPAFTKNASTWLNADAWENEPLPERWQPKTFAQQTTDNNNQALLRAVQGGGDPWSTPEEQATLRSGGRWQLGS